MISKDFLLSTGYFLDNSFLVDYIQKCNSNEFVEFSVSHRYSSEFKEIHHILPRCCGGDDTINNCIKVSYADHIYLHYLLTLIINPHTNVYYKLLQGYLMLSGCHSDDTDVELLMKIPNLVEQKKLAINLHKKRMTGRKLSNEQKHKISEGLRKWHKNEDSIRKENRLKKISEKRKGHEVTDITKAKMRATKEKNGTLHKGHTCNYSAEHNKKLSESLKEYYSNEENRKKMSERFKKSWTPEKRAALSNQRKGGHWYTNGIDDKFIVGDNIPDGFHKGKTKGGYVATDEQRKAASERMKKMRAEQKLKKEHLSETNSPILENEHKN